MLQRVGQKLCFGHLLKQSEVRTHNANILLSLPVTIVCSRGRIRIVIVRVLNVRPALLARLSLHCIISYCVNDA